MINQIPTKIRPDDVLGNLSEEDQDCILEWLENTSYREALKLIAEPPPEGFGLKIHYNSLRKFYLKNLPLRLGIHRHDEALEWKSLTAQTEFQPIDFQNLIRESLERQVMISLNETQPNNRRSIQLLECLIRWRNQELTQEKRALALRSALPFTPPTTGMAPAPKVPGAPRTTLNNLEQP